MRRGTLYQYVLIVFGLIATALLGLFLYREIFPEYRIYQKDYIALESFRSQMKNEPAPEFKEGIKQIVIEREDKGPPVIDRCISCHVALQIEDYSPTKLARDEKGTIKRDKAGIPIQIENPQYIWKLVENAIETAKDPSIKAGLENLKTAQVGAYTYDVQKVLKMHPLIGHETRAFEFHPVEDYGCVSCHGGNGRGLVTDRAHGPVFDGQYEEESVGFTPEFLEKDHLNDPSFSHVFNAKPGSRLLFQVNPLYVGALIQAKCMQCHTEKVISNEPLGAVELLTKDYQKGKELYITQGCYACHRIAGFARGGVGPELTREGESYPWFIKESIVWPQADLKTSTMPNLHLDHEELESLMTYMLGQTGKNKAVSETARKKTIQEWELGKKQPWEKPVGAREIHDLKYGMTVFAVEGCASCHRLLGYESNVGLKDEKDRTWFKTLFPEFILGSKLVQIIDAKSQEIDSKIGDHIRKDSLLEEIEAAHPGTLESFYSNFKFAARAKNHESIEVSTAWKERVKRVLMIFIETYGLGRVICPKPSWSGVYRSDQWILEHFQNPASHVPKSIMPVFPFDQTKFEALTKTLDLLAKANLAKEREVRKKDGFNPEAAYEFYCSQCHGVYLQGNGPVAQWIYPVPKNLKNPEFMRNLTKERVIESIKHGVPGTPMAPWGELGSGKSFENNQPILDDSEIQMLTDWLFSSLPGATIIRSDSEVPKWNYKPEDVIQELHDEGSTLKDSIFDAPPNKGIGPEKTAYFVKQKYYTSENILAGQKFFIENCAPCHGKEADGSSSRAEPMSDAKPRMLTNKDWLKSHDDLRLLRSIKYGVPGTSMTPWGDLSSSLQRLQLVIFIRNLGNDSQEKKK